MSCRFIAELGSNPLGEFGRIRAAIDHVQGTGVELKVQLFPKYSKYASGGNVYLAPEVFSRALEYARKRDVVLSASCFDSASCQFLIEQKVPWIKFAYSQRSAIYSIADVINAGIEPVVSLDGLADTKVYEGCTKLFCVPNYPTIFNICFDELFPRFDGFSDHTLGYRQSRYAIEAGAKVLEKHVKLHASDSACPDDRFSVSLDSFIQFAKEINNA